MKESDEIKQQNDRLLELNARLLGLLDQHGGPDKIEALNRQVFDRQRSVLGMEDWIKKLTDERDEYKWLYEEVLREVAERAK